MIVNSGRVVSHEGPFDIRGGSDVGESQGGRFRITCFAARRRRGGRPKSKGQSCSPLSTLVNGFEYYVDWRAASI